MGTVLRVPVNVVAAGRTDAGVHAWGQVFSCDVPDGTDLDTVRTAVNSLTPVSVALRQLEVASDGFSARFSATSRTYVYRLNTAREPDPFLHRFEWWVKSPLDIEAMRDAVTCLVGEHDFAAFCKAGSAGGTIRRVLGATLRTPDDSRAEVWLEATSFCHQMVRSIVGLLEAVGHGRRDPGEMDEVLRARDRSANSNVAPPHGLTLWRVAYGTETTP